VTTPSVQTLDEHAAVPLAGPTRNRVLDPIARTSEILFGLIMALTFTGTISAATGEVNEVRTLLVAAIACNIAWGLVDAVMFVMSSLAERGRDTLTVRTVRTVPLKASLTRDDWLGALAVFLLVLLSTFPVVLPFLIFGEVHVALRVSNLIAIVMMFLLGYRLGRYAGYHALRTGFAFVLLGLTLVAVTIALGG
jgi:VIT1/CCC1 family predicted Fe2+/Mn2+ transporter